MSWTFDCKRTVQIGENLRKFLDPAETRFSIMGIHNFDRWQRFLRPPVRNRREKTSAFKRTVAKHNLAVI